MDMDEELEEQTLDTMTNEEIIERYNEYENFLKVVNDEIKKTDIGDDNE